MADQNDIRDTENEIQRQERENREAQERRDRTEQAGKAARQERLENATRQRSEASVSTLLKRLNRTGNLISHLQLKRQLKTARLKLSQVKNSVLAKYDVGQIVVRLSPLLLYPATFGMNCLFLAFISRYYAHELLLDNALLKPYKATIILVSIILLPLFLLWMDISLQSQWVAAQSKAAKGLWFALAAVVCLVIPAIYIYTAWLNRDVNAGETEASVNNIMLLIKGAVGLVVNILVLLGGRLLHEGKSLLIFLLKISGTRLALNWLQFRIRRAQTYLVDTFNDFNRALTIFNNLSPLTGSFQAAIDLPTRHALREQFGYEVIAEPRSDRTRPAQARDNSKRSEAGSVPPNTGQSQEPGPASTDSGSDVKGGHRSSVAGAANEAPEKLPDTAKAANGTIFDGYGEEEVRP